jgi:hypothetical protein
MIYYVIVSRLRKVTTNVTTHAAILPISEWFRRQCKNIANATLGPNNARRARIDF